MNGPSSNWVQFSVEPAGVTREPRLDVLATSWRAVGRRHWKRWHAVVLWNIRYNTDMERSARFCFYISIVKAAWYFPVCSAEVRQRCHGRTDKWTLELKWQLHERWFLLQAISGWRIWNWALLFFSFFPPGPPRSFTLLQFTSHLWAERKFKKKKNLNSHCDDAQRVLWVQT